MSSILSSLFRHIKKNGQPLHLFDTQEDACYVLLPFEAYKRLTMGEEPTPSFSSEVIPLDDALNDTHDSSDPDIPYENEEEVEAVPGISAEVVEFNRG